MADPKYPVRRSNLHNVREQIGDHLVDVDDRVTALEGGAPLPSGSFDYIDFTTTLPDPVWKEGRLFYDETNKCMSFYNDEADIILQIGQELFMRVYNANGVTITNGSAVSVTGLTAESVPQVSLTDATSKTSAQAFIGLATHNIEPSTYGYVTMYGFVRDIDTSGLTAGSPCWVDSEVLGGLTTTEPESPIWYLRVGGVAKSDATAGIVFSRPTIGRNTEDTRRLYNGTVLEDALLTVTSDGVTCSASLENKADPLLPLSLMFDEEFHISPAPHEVTLTAGTDIVPVRNWLYFPRSTEVLTVSLTGFPNTEQFVPVADIIVQSAATAQAEGFYKVHAWTDHISSSTGQGHLSHINEWIRNRPAAWQSGCSVTPTVAEDVLAANIYLQYTSGVVYQLHRHAMPVFDNTGGDEFFLYNDPTTPYKLIPSLNATDITQDTNGVTLNNKCFNLVVWGVVSEDPADCQVLINLPTGSYSTEAGALADASAYTSYSLPNTYLGCAFLLTRVACKIQGGQIKILTDGVFDLRGVVPSASGGGGGGGGGVVNFTELLDTPASYAGAALDVVRVNAGENALEFYDTANWDTAYDKRLDSLTVTGNSGSATLIANILNIPTYTLAGLGGQVAGDYAVLNNTSANNNDYIYVSHNTTGSVLYVNQRGTGDIARFMYRVPDGTTSDDMLTITNTAGLETSSTILAEETVTVGNGATTGVDGKEYLRFQMERPWVFKQKDSGASTALELQSLNDKFFYITDSVRNVGFSFRPSTGDFVAAGNLRSKGINDYSTLEQIDLNNGYALLGHSTETGFSFMLKSSDALAFLGLSGGTSMINGANLILESAVDPDIRFRIGSSECLVYDSSATLWDFQSNDLITAGQITSPNYYNDSTSTRNKYSVWNTDPYTIGMGSGYTFGALGNDFAMTFQMNTTITRGFWWGSTANTNAQGAMSLNMAGDLTTARSIRTGYGSSDTTVGGATYTLDVSGDTYCTGDAHTDGSFYVRTSGEGVCFSFVTPANTTLDDYETGVFFVSLTGSTSGTYNLGAGYDTIAFTKIGRLVHIQGRIRVTSTSSPVGRIRMSLPFIVSGTLGDEAGVASMYPFFWNNGSTLGRPLLTPSAGFARGDFYQLSSGGALTNIDQTFVDTDFYITINGCYVTDE